MQPDVNEQLAAQRLVSELLLKQSKLDAEQLAVRNHIAQQQLAHTSESKSARLAERQSQVDQARAFMALKAREVDALRVRPGVTGILPSSRESSGGLQIRACLDRAHRGACAHA